MAGRDQDRDRGGGTGSRDGDLARGAPARRYDINPSQLFGWAKRFGPSAAQMAEGPSLELPRFATAVVDRAAISDTTPVSAAAPAPEPASIEISIGTAIVRIRGAADAKTLALVLKALRVLA